MSEKRFCIKGDKTPKGDQPRAIENLIDGLEKGLSVQTLLGVTGSGKTFTMANVIAGVNRPSLVLAPNKTLAAQLCAEFREVFPDNAVEYFVSYYDYYQPEAYLPSSDTYIEKDASINEEIEVLRHRATSALLSRRDTVIVASVSCIYGLGSPSEYLKRVMPIRIADVMKMKEISSRLVSMQYERAGESLERGRFRIKGDTIEIYPPYEESTIRIEFFDEEVEFIKVCDPVSGRVESSLEVAFIFPATHYLIDESSLAYSISSIRRELEERERELKSRGKAIEAYRLRTRVEFDIEMLENSGYCKGIENYSRHLDGRDQGEPPYTLIDFFPEDFIVFIDESHLAIPQLNGMYSGDRSRKESLVQYGFRLPSAFDNRPLRFNEFLDRTGQIITVSATPGQWELRNTKRVVEQIIRPTGLVDPELEVRETENQVDDLIGEINERVDLGQRVLVTTLTKRMAEDLTEYMRDLGIKAKYLHSEIGTLERISILKELRSGEFDVLVGINLLREGLDLPEVTLVAILDADREGFLRDERSIIQTIGRSARNVEGKAILYARKVTGSIERAVAESDRRRKKQIEYNEKHGINPESIRKTMTDIMEMVIDGRMTVLKKKSRKREGLDTEDPEELKVVLDALEEEMREAALDLNFEYAAVIRDHMKELKKRLMGMAREELI